MSITITVRELVDGVENGIPLLVTRKMRPNPSFWFSRQVKRMRKEYLEYNKARLVLAKQFGHEEPLGSGVWQVKEIDRGAFSEAVDDLFDSSIEISLEPRTIEYLGLDDLEPAVFDSLSFLFVDPSEEKHAEKDAGKISAEDLKDPA